MQPPTVPVPTSAPPAADGPAAAATPRGRLDGVDIARGLAIIGMVMVHVAPPILEDGGWYTLSHGRASTLFLLLAGVGISLSTRRGRVGDHVGRLLWRATWLLPLGLALQAFGRSAGVPVAVILQYYAVWFVLATPMLRWRTRTLVVTIAVGLLVGPTILIWSKVAHPEWYVPWRGVWHGWWGDILLTGYYPTVSWFWIVLLGMVVGRLPLRSRRTMTQLVVVGAVTAAGAYALGAALRATLSLGGMSGLLSTRAHAGTTLSELAAAGVAVAVLGACLLLGDVAGRALRPMVLFGRIALTVYVGHLLAYAAARDAMYNTTASGGLATTLTVTAVGVVFATAWLSWRERGPLEALDRLGHERLVAPLVRLVRPTPPTDAQPL